MQHEDKSHAPKNLSPAPRFKDDERRRSGSEKVGKCWNQSEGFGTIRISLHLPVTGFTIRYMSFFSCSKRILSWRWTLNRNLALKRKLLPSSYDLNLCCKHVHFKFFCTSFEKELGDFKMASGNVTLETLNFDNLALRTLPIDKETKNYVRQVSGACFSRVKPAPVENARTVAYSSQAMSLLDLPQEELKRDDFPEYFSGNKLLPGAEPSAHCYCGHQFGYFSGQLGDGAAM